MTSEAVCPRCGSAMVERTNRESGEPFLGCTRFPECRGTQPMPTRRGGAVAARPTRYKLSTGSRRARDLPDVVELLVARAVGRNLTPIQGCIVQIVAVAVFGFLLWALFASGLIMRILEPLAQWYTSQMHFGPTPSPGP
jgi:ssDNA-binding Zn-finger/Zn-ribbon topoisomerase 1